MRITSFLALLFSPLFVIICVANDEDDFYRVVRESEADFAGGKAPEWVGAFSRAISSDEEMHVHISDSKEFAFRHRSVFGLGKGRVLNITIDSGEMHAKSSVKEFHCPGPEHPLVVIKAQGCVFLIPAGIVHGFCINYRDGNDLNKYLHRGDVSGSLELHDTSSLLLPDRYKHLDGLEAMRLPVSKARQTKDGKLIVELKADGVIQHLFLGMEFSCRGMLFEISKLDNDQVFAKSIHPTDSEGLKEVANYQVFTSR